MVYVPATQTALTPTWLDVNLPRPEVDHSIKLLPYAYAGYDPKVKGVFNADQIVVDTGPVLVTGGGSINMDTERLDLKVQGHPKKFRLLRLMMPITAEGPLLHPKVGVEPGKAIAQAGAGVALASFLSPLAAILPFIDPGLAKDANCGGLIAEGAQHGAPVKGAAPAEPARRSEAASTDGFMESLFR